MSVDARIDFDGNDVFIQSGVAWYLSGVDQSSPERDVATATGTGTTTSISVGAATGDLVLDATGAYRGSSGIGDLAVPTVAGDQTLSGRRTDSTVFHHSAIGGSSGNDSTPSWTWNVSEFWHAIAVAVKAG